jgi:hypothetical protein
MPATSRRGPASGRGQGLSTGRTQQGAGTMNCPVLYSTCWSEKRSSTIRRLLALESGTRLHGVRRATTVSRQPDASTDSDALRSNRRLFSMSLADRAAFSRPNLSLAFFLALFFRPAALRPRQFRLLCPAGPLGRFASSTRTPLIAAVALALLHHPLGLRPAVGRQRALVNLPFLRRT